MESSLSFQLLPCLHIHVLCIPESISMYTHKHGKVILGFIKKVNFVCFFLCLSWAQMGNYFIYLAPKFFNRFLTLTEIKGSTKVHFDIFYIVHQCRWLSRIWQINSRESPLLKIVYSMVILFSPKNILSVALLSFIQKIYFHFFGSL